MEEMKLNFCWGTSQEVSKLDDKSIPSLCLVCEDGELPGVKTSLSLPIEKITGQVKRGERIVALKGEDSQAEFCLLGGITPPDLTAPRKQQAKDIFVEIENVLKELGFSFDDVVRTWFYVDEVCQWYGDFNAARSEFFETRGVFDHFLPASTGIGVANIEGAALIAGLIAMRPKVDGAKAEIVESPLQEPAMAYRSSFSRAAEIITATKASRLYISGTASIAPHSHDVAHIGDIKAQIGQTMKAVLAILESRSYNWENVSRAIVYLKKSEYKIAWQEWLEENALPKNFAIETVCDVCRDEWLFEIEVDATRSKS